MSVLQAAEAEVGQSAEAGGAQVGQDVIVAGGGVVVGAAGPGGGYPDQATVLVGQGEEVQAAAVVLAGVVPLVGRSGAALGADEGAVDENHLPALRDDLVQGAVQATRTAPGRRAGLSARPASVGRWTRTRRCRLPWRPGVRHGAVRPGRSPRSSPVAGSGHRDLIAFRWRRSRSAWWLTVRVDRERRHR